MSFPNLDPARLRALLDGREPFRVVPISDPRPGQTVLCSTCHRMRPASRTLAVLSEPAGTFACAGCLATAARVSPHPLDL